MFGYDLFDEGQNHEVGGLDPWILCLFSFFLLHCLRDVWKMVIEHQDVLSETLSRDFGRTSCVELMLGYLGIIKALIHRLISLLLSILMGKQSFIVLWVFY